MMFRTHFVFSLLVGLYFLDSFNGNKFLFLFLILLFGSLADIDNPKSKLGKNFWFLSKPFNLLFGHRKLFHSLLIPIILGLAVWYLFDKWWMPIFLGYSSHVLLDGFTLEGINFIYPFRQLRLSGFIETGKKEESFIFYFFIFLNALLIFRILF